jgi:hypothetical protein
MIVAERGACRFAARDAIFPQIGRSGMCPGGSAKKCKRYRGSGTVDWHRPFSQNQQRRLRQLIQSPATESTTALEYQRENSHRQRKTVIAERSPTRPPPMVGGGAPSPPGKLSKPHPATRAASRCDAPTSVRELSKRARPQDCQACSEAKNRSALRCSGGWLRGEEPQPISLLLVCNCKAG